jgi:hypothetical protein
MYVRTDTGIIVKADEIRTVATAEQFGRISYTL